MTSKRQRTRAPLQHRSIQRKPREHQEAPAAPRVDAAPRVPEPSPRPEHDNLRLLHQTLGNAGVARLLVQRNGHGGKPAVAAPVPAAAAKAAPGIQREEPDEDVEVSDVWFDLTGDFGAYVRDMGLVNAQYRTVTRERWSAAFEKLWAQAGKPGERTDAELLELRKAFEKLENLFVDENTAAYEAWGQLQEAYNEEREDLAGSHFIEDVVAMETLQDLFEKTNTRVDACGEHLVTEDLVALHHMLENQTHIARGIRAAEEERKRQRRLEKEFEEEEEEEGPSALGVAWDVVGWDSAGDFALDVGLTIVTGGLGKITKIFVKGRKAKKKLDKVRKAAKARKLRKARRLERLAEGTTKLLKSMGEALDKFDAPGYVDWIKKNWKKTLRAYVTDELGEGLSGGNPAEAKTVLERLSKDAAGEYASRLLGISSSDEEKQFELAVFSYAAGMSSTGLREFRRYLAMNLRRRGLSNAIYYGARVGIGETKLSAEVLVDIAASTAGEMAQDFVNQIPGAPKTLVETARKTLQNEMAGAIKSALR
jgi:hypothetical protein